MPTLATEFTPAAMMRSPDKAVPFVFEQQAAATPDAVVVLFEDRALTYAQKATPYLEGRGVERQWGPMEEHLCGTEMTVIRVADLADHGAVSEKCVFWSTRKIVTAVWPRLLEEST